VGLFYRVYVKEGYLFHENDTPPIEVVHMCTIRLP